MTSRHREETILSKSTAWAFNTYVGTLGSCTTSPGPPITPTYLQYGSGNASHTIVRTFDDVVTPNFRVLRSQGKIINNPMVSTYEENYDPVFSLDISLMSNRWGCTPARYYPYQDGVFKGTWSVLSLTGAFPAAPTVDVVRLQDIAINKAWAKISPAEVLAISSVAEFNSTVAGFADLLKKLIRICKAVRRGNIRRLRREISKKELAELYMNARYNIRPLYYDAVGYLNAIEKCTQVYPPRQTFRSGISDSKSETVETPFVLWSG